MPDLQRLRLDHAAALLVFEQVNRQYFAASIPDRGDAYFTGFTARLESLLAEQEAGVCHFHLLVDADGAVLGRINLIDVAHGAAELGYRIARAAAGRGLATAWVARVCELAADVYGLTSLRAATTLDNTGSRTVLARNGFTAAAEIVLDGRPGLTYVRDLTPHHPDRRLR